MFSRLFGVKQGPPADRLRMNIAILGTGPIGSTFAFNLARNGHDVTVIARGNRLEQLQADQAIVTVSGERAPVNVMAALDPTVRFDLVLVTVLVSQVDAVLPSLKASGARTVMFMHNTFESLSPLRDAVGKERFAFGFPAILALLPDGKLKADIVNFGQTTIATDRVWAKVFTDAGIRTLVQVDMESWLRTHAAFIVPFMTICGLAYSRQSGVSWAEAKTYALAMREGFELVRRLGNVITPSGMKMLIWAPTSTVTLLLWMMSRMTLVRLLGEKGPTEARALIDAMVAAVPDHTSVLRSIRP